LTFPVILVVLEKVQYFLKEYIYLLIDLSCCVGLNTR